MKSMEKGFTLIEVLIVCIIIAVLAGLIVPRMNGQIERGQAAEALQLAGAIINAAQSRADMKGDYAVSGGVISSSPLGGTVGSWAMLGVTGPQKSKNWSYRYLTNGYTTFRLEVVSETNGANAIYYNGDSDTWTCSGIFEYKVTGVPSQGCTI